ncbi:histidine kinase [Gilvimarinus xylanilyticus]|uniref:Histidine kinase n=1 Tax=Gilvimarinus xylanilyticus TaxID=2944139 RepID=A0A9X2KX03_9GAMM|nr:histidine kinase [Gilvimarinus xylanilyticus]MCP8900090.1 histidine kinase [Gilvimarinus xylanilyticus]
MNERVKQLIHDARNPLNNISVNAELGKLALQSNSDIERSVAALDVILQECQRCSQTLQELADTLGSESDK